MFTTTDSATTERASIFVYGASGSGKTQLARTLNPKETLIINAENGLIGLRDLPIDVYDITVDGEGTPMARNFRFEKLIAFLHKLNEKEYKEKYKYIFIDSFTEIAQCLVEFLKVKYPDNKDALNLWGDNKNMILGLAKSLRDFTPYNIIIVALEETEKDEVGRRFSGISVPGSASQLLGPIFDEVLNLRKFPTQEGGEVSKLVTSNHETLKCKDRSGELEKFEDPNLTVIFNKILNKEKKDV